jgi:hypothetical protein
MVGQVIVSPRFGIAWEACCACSVLDRLSLSLKAHGLSKSLPMFMKAPSQKGSNRSRVAVLINEAA